MEEKELRLAIAILEAVAAHLRQFNTAEFTINHLIIDTAHNVCGNRAHTIIEKVLGLTPYRLTPYQEEPEHCELCGEAKPDVEYVADPWIEDVRGEDVKRWLCGECYGDRMHEV